MSWLNCLRYATRSWRTDERRSTSRLTWTKSLSRTFLTVASAESMIGLSRCKFSTIGSMLTSLSLSSSSSSSGLGRSAWAAALNSLFRSTCLSITLPALVLRSAMSVIRWLIWSPMILKRSNIGSEMTTSRYGGSPRVCLKLSSKLS